MLYDESIIDKISLRLENDDLGDKPFTFLIGGITIFIETDKPPEDPVNFKIDNIEQLVNAKESQKFYNRDKINLDVSWKYDEKIWYTYIFRCVVTDKNNRNEYLGRTSNNIFHIHNLKRHEDELYSMISIKSVGCNLLVNSNEALVRV